MRPVTRITPNIAVQNMQTYELSAPKTTHFRPASCQEVECRGYVHGWETILDESTALGQKQAYYIRMHSGRKYNMYHEGGLTRFVFFSGQRCFAQHVLPLEREPLYIVRGGDWRGNPTRQRRLHANGSDWVEDFAEHQDDIATRIQRG